MPIYFGVNLRFTKYGFIMTRENYAIIDNKSSNKDWCKKHFEKCLLNYDLNIKYFASLDKEEFNKELNKFLFKHKGFEQIYDLNEYKNISGYYMLVLDEYCQVYIGTAQDIKIRILNHWSKQKQFDRLIFGTVENSILAIDSFRAYDTTRIYVYPTSNTFNEEDKFINSISHKFLLNRTVGGKLENGLLEAIINRKVRKLK